MLIDFCNFSKSATMNLEGGKVKQLANVLIALSVISVALSIIGALGTDLWLASTQWVLVGGVLAIWAVYLKIES